MGFALWIENDVARAEGTHEYRPMGAAVIASTSQFAARDFRPGRARRPAAAAFEGFFGSLVDVNAHLVRRRRGEVPARASRRVLPYF